MRRDGRKVSGGEEVLVFLGGTMNGAVSGRLTGDIPGLDRAEQRTWEQFLDASQLLYAVLSRELVEAHQLPLGDLRLLIMLGRSPTGALRMGELADSLLVLPSRVTRQVRRLETHGLVARIPSAEDGRAVLAGITDRGREALAGAMVTYGQSIRGYFLRELSRPQRVALGESCRRIANGLRAPRPAGQIP